MRSTTVKLLCYAAAVMITGISIVTLTYEGVLGPFSNLLVVGGLVYGLILGGVLAIAGLIIGKHERMIKTVNPKIHFHKRYQYVCYVFGIIWFAMGIFGLFVWFMSPWSSFLG